jgi:hypothetical protein
MSLVFTPAALFASTEQAAGQPVNMFYSSLADALVFVHAAFCAFVLFGQVFIVLVWLCRFFQSVASTNEEPGYRLPVFGWIARWGWVRNPWFRSIHLACILVVAFEASIQFTCPLTTWENDLRELAGEPIRGSSFVGRLLNDILFSEDYDNEIVHKIHMTFGGFVLFTFLFFPPRFRSKPAVASGRSESPPAASDPAVLSQNGHPAAATDPAVRALDQTAVSN